MDFVSMDLLACFSEEPKVNSLREGWDMHFVLELSSDFDSYLQNWTLEDEMDDRSSICLSFILIPNPILDQFPYLKV